MLCSASQVTSENVMLLMVSHWLRSNHHHASSSSNDKNDAVSGVCAAAEADGTPKGPLGAAGQQEGGEAEEAGAGAVGGDGDGDGGGAPPSVTAQLLALVRYGGLTPHFRDGVAPCLPGLAAMRCVRVREAG